MAMLMAPNTARDSDIFVKAKKISIPDLLKAGIIAY
jgi:hypothetical protein